MSQDPLLLYDNLKSFLDSWFKGAAEKFKIPVAKIDSMLLKSKYFGGRYLVARSLYISLKPQSGEHDIYDAFIFRDMTSEQYDEFKKSVAICEQMFRDIFTEVDHGGR